MNPVIIEENGVYPKWLRFFIVGFLSVSGWAVIIGVVFLLARLFGI